MEEDFRKKLFLSQQEEEENLLRSPTFSDHPANVIDQSNISLQNSKEQEYLRSQAWLLEKSKKIIEQKQQKMDELNRKKEQFQSELLHCQEQINIQNQILKDQQLQLQKNTEKFQEEQQKQQRRIEEQVKEIKLLKSKQRSFTAASITENARATVAAKGRSQHRRRHHIASRFGHKGRGSYNTGHDEKAIFHNGFGYRSHRGRSSVANVRGNGNQKRGVGHDFRHKDRFFWHSRSDRGGFRGNNFKGRSKCQKLAKLLVDLSDQAL